jgi:hypothetical protein
MDALPILLLLVHAANAFDSTAPIVISGCDPALPRWYFVARFYVSSIPPKLSFMKRDRILSVM